MLRLKTLGGLSIQRDESPPSGAATQRRRLALLALLARAGDTGLSRDKLLGYLWPESEPDKARGVLAQALYALKRDLGADELFLGTTDLRLNPACITSDVGEFCAHVAAGRPAEAVSLYAGAFLDGIFISEAPEFERWVDTQRAELAHDYAAALDRLARDATAAGDHRAAVGWWRKLAAADPLSARVAVELMQALAAAGDRAGAIQHARVYEALLRQELDVGPDPEVIRLADRLREEPPPAVVPAPMMPAPTTAPRQAVATAAAPVGAPSAAAPPLAAAGAPPRTHPVLRFGIVATLVLLLGIGGLLGRGLLREAEADSRKMIAVLPFENLGAPDDEYFADGLTEEVISRLSTVAGLGVISRTSVMQYKGSDKGLRDIARELGVDYVLEGTVRWDRLPDGTSRVRVTPQLIQVSDDSHLWADRFDAALADVFQVQTRIAERVTDALGVTLGALERRALEDRPTENLQAYDQYLRGNVRLDRSWGDKESLLAAVASYDSAVALDPGFAEAQAKLSIANTMMFRMGYDATEARLATARAAADRATALDPDLPAAKVALGFIHYWGQPRDLAGAREHFLAALRRQPGHPDALFALGAVERRQGLWPDAVRHLSEAADLDPRSSDKAWNCGLALLFVRDFARAERYLDRAIALAPDWAYPYGTKADLYLAWHGDLSRAREVLRGYPARDVPELVAAIGIGLPLLLSDSGWRVAVEQLTPEQFGTEAPVYYRAKATLFRTLGDSARERVYADSLVRSVEPGVRLRPNSDEPHVALALSYGWLKRGEEALRAVERAKQILPPESDAAWGTDRALYFAHVYTEIGAHDLAIAELERLLAIPSRMTPARLRVDPLWVPLRSDPRFQRLLEGTRQTS